MNLMDHVINGCISSNCKTVKDLMLMQKAKQNLFNAFSSSSGWPTPTNLNRQDLVV